MVVIENHWDVNGAPFAVPEGLAAELLKANPAMKIVEPKVYWRPSLSLRDFTESRLGEPHLMFGTGLNPCGEIPLPNVWGGECWIGRKLPEPPKPVNSKHDYYTRYIAGEFGNRLQLWGTYGEWESSGFSGPIGIRNRKPDSPFCRYDIPHRLVKTVVDEFISKGCPPGDMTFNEAAPDQDLLIQGEFCINYDGVFELIYSRVKRQMRIALKEKSEYAHGNHAKTILKHFVDINSYEWMEWLLDAYPGHTVEFSTYCRNLGSIPHRNTLIWEVRNY